MESRANTFSVKVIPTSDTVHDLKKLIKVEKANDFKDVDADKFTLWSVSVLVDSANIHTPTFFDKIDRKTELVPTAKLSKAFGTEVPEDSIHIISMRLSIYMLQVHINGHGRALELLWEATIERDMLRCNVSELMIQLRNGLAARYDEAFPDSDEAKAITYAVLTHQRLLQHQHVPNTKKYPDKLVEPGLIRFEKD
ncbi:hypothetical protein EDD21DRAFT_420236 [Dissophora ornata]|nr:hypothetical protein EDD21DRAFT_420236 [Dissophora ornata]